MNCYVCISVKADSMFVCLFVCLMGFYVTIAFSGGGSRSTRREPPTLGK